MESIHEEKRNGLTIKIFSDDNPIRPDEGGDDSLFLTAYHRDFAVDGPHTYYKNTEGKTVKGALVVTKEDCIKIAEDTKHDARKKYHVFGLEAYIHSGIRLALSNEGQFPDRSWDVSQLGVVFVSREYWKTANAARKAALSLIQEWNDYLSGNVYGYRIENDAGEEIESGCGYPGDYDAKDGALEEARGMVDYLTNKGKTDASGQYLFEFARG